MSSSYSKRIVLDGITYRADVTPRQNGTFTASVFVLMDSDTSDPERPSEKQRGSSIVPSYWKAIKVAEDMLSGCSGHKVWLGAKDDLCWIRGYSGDDTAEFVELDTPIRFSDGRARAVKRILKLRGQYVVEVSPGECWVGEMAKDGGVLCHLNCSAFFEAIEGR
jgi:hypothetical protein